MKICLLVSSLGNGGAERVATTLCNAWAERGDDVMLMPTFSGGGHPFHKVSSAVELVYLADRVGITKKHPWSYAKRIVALRNAIKEQSPDVVVSFLPNVNVAAVLSCSFLRIPLIICERRDPSSQPCPGYWEYACRLTYRHADMVTLQTDDAAARAQQIYPGLRKVRSIPNPLPDALFANPKRSGNKRKILLSLGRLSAEKQISKSIRAFRDVASRFDDWDLHIYGDGPERSACASLIDELNLSGRVVLKGQTADAWAVMAGADAFIMTSRCEGFPNALLEACGIGLPCVVFDCPSGPKEITRGGEDALLVPLDDHGALVAALSRIMDDAAFRISLGRHARESTFNRFRLGAVMNSWDRLFSEVGAKNGVSSGSVPGNGFCGLASTTTGQS